MKQIITTDQAPAAIGTYSQAVQANNHVYISGQIPLDPKTMNMIEGNIEAEIRQVFNNFFAIMAAAGANAGNVVKLNIYLTDLANFSLVNEVMLEYFPAPYPARLVLGVAALPKNARIEMDGILVLDVF